MTLVHRVLPAEPLRTLDDYIATGGGKALAAVGGVDAEAVVSELEASGLRGRGGAGFPTGRKWRTVRENRSSVESTSVVVNAAEGEPGTFKDRAILRANPYHVLEGALVAAHTVAADEVIVAMKRSFATEMQRVRSAIEELRAAGWADGVELIVFDGPDEYLYGEETALLETIDGRQPFPRITPPFRRGVREIVETPADVRSGSGASAHVEMAGPTGDTVAPPTLVDNVETLANVPGIVVEGAGWFRALGTDESPGTIVCTITGSTRRHGVGEVAMGTPLRAVIDAVGGGLEPGHRVKAVLPGVANALIPGSMIDTAVSYEAMAAIGSGLGSAGFLVLDDTDDLASVAAGVSRFLAIESCGQCTPCKHDGLALAEHLARISRSEATEDDLAAAESRVATVADEARCSLAVQHQAVIGSILRGWADELRSHLAPGAEARDVALITELVDIAGEVAVADERYPAKQPDWSHDEIWSGTSPAEKFGEHRAATH